MPNNRSQRRLRDINRQPFRSNRPVLKKENCVHLSLSDARASNTIEKPDPTTLAHTTKPLKSRLFNMKVFIIVLLIGGAIYYEMKYSQIQSRFFAKITASNSYSLQPGRVEFGQIPYPQRGPFDMRLGYSHLPDFLSVLTEKNYQITAQARWSNGMQLTHQWGIFPLYREKTRTGLQIKDHQGQLIYQASYPHQSYITFTEISPLIVDTLLFIENRELLDEDKPNLNPAIEWDRMARVTADLLVNIVSSDDDKLAGGSTLATQIEKYRHSPDGITTSPAEKIRQMASASLRTYLDGENTYATRQRIVLDYINTVPLAARGSFGEVHGIGDGLRVWYGEDLRFTESLLRETHPVDSEMYASQAMAFKQVLSLFLAQRRPSYYLASGEPQHLEKLTNTYLTLLADAHIISREFAKVASSVKLNFSPSTQKRNIEQTFVSNKAVNVTRNRLTSLLGLDSLYELDRLDLAVKTTFNQTMQNIATTTLRRMQETEQAKAAGLYGERLLKPTNDLSKVIYSFTLFERTPQANLVRIQADNLNQPFDINEGVKLDLGSTAKLRTLVSYLNVIAALHETYANQTDKELALVEVEPNNVLARWAIDYLRNAESRDITLMLAAAMERTYSASPRERFLTGGGIHTFVNFDKLDNGKVMTVREAFRNSVNLPFIRMMRDIVRYHMLNVPGSAAKLLEDVNDERRGEYLARFADHEGSSFIQQFYKKYKNRSQQEILDLLLNGRKATPQRLAIIYNSTVDNPSLAGYERILRERLPDSTLNARDVKAIFEKNTPERYNLPDRGYIARIHPLELWTAHYLIRNPVANAKDVLQASITQRQEVYSWLLKTRHKNAQDLRIRQLLEVEAFLEIHREWKRLGYPFDSLVASYATAIGSSADRPAALAELMGILLNDGIRLPTLRIDEFHFAKDTPYEVILNRKLGEPERVLSAAVAAEMRKALHDVVELGTARRLQHPFQDDNINVVIGGKTGTGDHRREVFGKGGQLRESTVVNRTATFVFYIGDQYFGTITAFVPGHKAKYYRFTSGLPVQLLKTLAPSLKPYLYPDKKE